MAKKSRIDSWTLMKIIVIPCLFLCAIFKHPAFQWIACAALVLWVCFVLVDFIHPRMKKDRKVPTEMKPVEASPEVAHTSEPKQEDNETQLTLLRQVNYRVMEQLKRNYPMVAWLWETRPTSEEISKGCTKRIKLSHCDPFNFGEVTLTSNGNLEIALIQLVPLAEANQQPEADEDLNEQDILDRSDVKQWYTGKGIAILSELIDELNVQGHKRLIIKENGEVFVMTGSKPQSVETIPNFPPRPSWDDLCVLAREDDISVEVNNQELAVSWA